MTHVLPFPQTKLLLHPVLLTKRFEPCIVFIHIYLVLFFSDFSNIFLNGWVSLIQTKFQTIRLFERKSMNH